jgi:L-threonylcarbamoyladenylate synthase
MKVIQPGDLTIAAAALAAGQLVAVPTDRWYMICANAADPQACARIFAGKRRPQTKPLAYIATSASAAADLFLMSDQARRLAQTFWPGHLAMIMPWRDHPIGDRHAAVGTPNALVTCDPGILGTLAAACSVAIAATTVNVSGDSGATGAGPAVSIREVQTFADQTATKIALCIDGGTCPLANHMTIVDCTTDRATITRAGVVHERAILDALT